MMPTYSLALVRVIALLAAVDFRLKLEQVMSCPLRRMRDLVQFQYFPVTAPTNNFDKSGSPISIR